MGKYLEIRLKQNSDFLKCSPVKRFLCRVNTCYRCIVMVSFVDGAVRSKHKINL